MSLRLRPVLRILQGTHNKHFSTATKVKDEQASQLCSFRTIENNPTHHNMNYIGKLYKVPLDIQQQLFQIGGFPKQFVIQANTFQEYAIMVRQPAVEIISYLTQADYTRPVNKYVIYGKHGTGKSITLAHILHYAFVQKYIIVHLMWGYHWFHNMKEVANSVLSPGCMDLPIDAGFWLKQFKVQNLNLLTQLDLRTSKDYTWNQHEMTSQGTPILGMIEFGMSRVKYACGVVDALLKELKLASTAGKCKTLVAIDGFNAFTSEETDIRDDNKVSVPPKKVTLAIPFLDITKGGDWCNGAVVLTVDKIATFTNGESHLPRYLLGKEGFEHLDPFLPVQVDEYNSAEFDSMIEYYKERKWIRSITPEGQKELELITNKNPLTLMKQCSFL
ncbi:PREDICTED: 28S ribosomal protein S29, mitochondrial [Dinoponera quadriceps]|uniref:Small ribosomal subunit protein mS29 n=1 Tax=Dinoponera quadriceps TaxID=609295 RepID=A0A6P3WMZ9_DINQU|nr:PREDICTED: 28S ribosomal protein S29, mitochondrial [Dinoponera quadriceps]